MNFQSPSELGWIRPTVTISNGASRCLDPPSVWFPERWQSRFVWDRSWCFQWISCSVVSDLSQTESVLSPPIRHGLPKSGRFCKRRESSRILSALGFPSWLHSWWSSRRSLESLVSPSNEYSPLYQFSRRQSLSNLTSMSFAEKFQYKERRTHKIQVMRRRRVLTSDPRKTWFG